LAQSTSNKRRAVAIHPPARLVGEPKKTKKKTGRKKDTRNSGKLAIRPDHPRRRIKIELCVVCGLRCVVIHVKCQVWSKSVKGLRRCGGRKWLFPITLASGLYNSLYYRTSRDFW